jgi:hypothetical protein
VIEIHGHSDDLIEVEGSITEEFYPGGKPSYLSFSDGTVLEVVYVKGVWRINRLAAGEAVYRKEESPGEVTNYSDRVYLDEDAEGRGAIEWVVFGQDFVRSK